MDTELRNILNKNNSELKKIKQTESYNFFNDYQNRLKYFIKDKVKNKINYAKNNTEYTQSKAIEIQNIKKNLVNKKYENYCKTYNILHKVSSKAELENREYFNMKLNKFIKINNDIKKKMDNSDNNLSFAYYPKQIIHKKKTKTINSSQNLIPKGTITIPKKSEFTKKIENRILRMKNNKYKEEELAYNSKFNKFKIKPISKSQNLTCLDPISINKSYNTHTKKVKKIKEFFKLLI